MCGGTCGQKSKIFAGVGIGLGVLGIIIYIAGHVTAGAAANSIGYVMENSAGGTLNVKEGDGGLGYFIDIKASDFPNCATIASAITIADPNGGTVSIYASCTAGQTASDDDPPLMRLGNFGLPDGPTMNEDGTTYKRLPGNYVIASTTELWIMDPLKELAEAAGGLLASLGIGLFGIILGISGSICCCISCCVMDKNPV